MTRPESRALSKEQRLARARLMVDYNLAKLRADDFTGIIGFDHGGSWHTTPFMRSWNPFPPQPAGEPVDPFEYFGDDFLNSPFWTGNLGDCPTCNKPYEITSLARRVCACSFMEFGMCDLCARAYEKGHVDGCPNSLPGADQLHPTITAIITDDGIDEWLVWSRDRISLAAIFRKDGVMVEDAPFSDATTAQVISARAAYCAGRTGEQARYLLDGEDVTLADFFAVNEWLPLDTVLQIAAGKVGSCLKFDGGTAGVSTLTRVADVISIISGRVM